MYCLFDGSDPGYQSHESSPDENGTADAGPDGMDIAGLVAFIGGTTAVVTGLLLAIVNAQGVRRQRLLRGEGAFLHRPEPAEVSISAFADPSNGAGGLRLAVQF